VEILNECFEFEMCFHNGFISNYPVCYEILKNRLLIEAKQINIIENLH